MVFAGNRRCKRGRWHAKLVSCIFPSVALPAGDYLPTDLAALLHRADQADPQAADQLFAALYSELRRDPNVNLLEPLLRNTLLPTLNQVLATRDPLLTGVVFPPQVVDEVTEFMKALTDPSARNLQHVIPQRVPSGLPVDGALGAPGS